MLTITLLVALVAAPASAQGYGVKGKSTLEFKFIITFFNLNYRVTDTVSLLAGFETVISPGLSGVGYEVGLAYYPTVASEKFEPYLWAEFSTLGVTIIGLGTTSASSIQLGVGASSKVSDLLTLRGSVYVTNIAVSVGTSVTNFDAGLRINFQTTPTFH